MLLATSACGGGSDDSSAAACETAWAEAAEVPEAERRPDLLWRAGAVCPSFEAWNEQAITHRDLLNGRTPLEMAETVCRYGYDPGLEDSELCASVGTPPE